MTRLSRDHWIQSTSVGIGTMLYPAWNATSSAGRLRVPVALLVALVVGLVLGWLVGKLVSVLDVDPQAGATRAEAPTLFGRPLTRKALIGCAVVLVAGAGALFGVFLGVQVGIYVASAVVMMVLVVIALELISDRLGLEA